MNPDSKDCPPGSDSPLARLRTGAFAGAQRLTLKAGLSEFPAEIFELADTLEILDLSGNALSTLPDELPRLHKLRILFCADNQFTALPAVLGRCPQLEMVGFKANRIREVSAAALPARLRWLILTDNAIESLPDALGQCTRLQKLALAGNRLRSLPSTLARCERLELLRVSANQLDELPAWLLEMPRLTWLAFGGNPFCEPLEERARTQTPLAPIAWPSLTLQRQLGEGASGVIHQALWRLEDAAPATELALKVFKGEVTSDGWPGSEMAAALQAGAHPHLIPLRGRLTDHPTQAPGLAMALIAPSFRSLAGPPSLASCTRDVYADDARFELQALLRLATGMASALAHLHAQGLSHGDFYAHNILRDASGHAYLGDFGAASLFRMEERSQAHALQRLEVRAFGCLLEELRERCAGPAPGHQPLLDRLRALEQTCLGERPAERPLFEAIERELRALQALLAQPASLDSAA